MYRRPYGTAWQGLLRAVLLGIICWADPAELTRGFDTYEKKQQMHQNRQIAQQMLEDRRRQMREHRRGQLLCFSW
jgi:hypothetical protein